MLASWGCHATRRGPSRAASRLPAELPTRWHAAAALSPRRASASVASHLSARVRCGRAALLQQLPRREVARPRASLQRRRPQLGLASPCRTAGAPRPRCARAGAGPPSARRWPTRRSSSVPPESPPWQPGGRCARPRRAVGGRLGERGVGPWPARRRLRRPRAALAASANTLSSGERQRGGRGGRLGRRPRRASTARLPAGGAIARPSAKPSAMEENGARAEPRHRELRRRGPAQGRTAGGESSERGAARASAARRTRWPPRATARRVGPVPVDRLLDDDRAAVGQGTDARRERSCRPAARRHPRTSSAGRSSWASSCRS